MYQPDPIRYSMIMLSMILLFVLGIAAPGCARYQFGSQGLYRQDIRTIHVPVIESDSFRRNLGERLTEAIIREIETNTPYKVVATAEEADSVLNCHLSDDRKRLLVETRTDEPRNLEWGAAVQVSWVGRQGQPLMQRSQVALPNAIVEVAQDSSFVPEAGQSVATAQQEAIDRMARQISGSLQVWW